VNWQLTAEASPDQKMRGELLTHMASADHEPIRGSEAEPPSGFSGQGLPPK